MDQETKVAVEGEEGEEVRAPKAEELLAAVQEFDKKSDPLDLSTKPSGDAPHHAAALLAGRKLSRLARRFAGAHDKEVVALRALHLEAEKEVAEYRDEAVDAGRLLKEIRKALDGGVLFLTRGEGREAGVKLLDRLNEATGDPRRESAKKEAPDATL